MGGCGSKEAGGVAANVAQPVNGTRNAPQPTAVANKPLSQPQASAPLGQKASATAPPPASKPHADKAAGDANSAGKPQPYATDTKEGDKIGTTSGTASEGAKHRSKGKKWVFQETADVRSVYEFDPNPLGKGQFGTTRLATHRKTGEKLACKSISKRKLNNDDEIEDVRREVQILYHLKGHANVVQIREHYEDTQYVHIIMELASGGELFDRIVARGHYTEKDAAAAFRTMVQVIHHCHTMGVMHRDLKPENFLLADKTDNAVLKATDFGLSVFFKEGQTFNEIVGSAFYVAPEVLKRKYSKESDIWSLGIMLYILLSGVPPFYGDNEAAIFQEVLTGKLDLESSPWPAISREAKQLVRQLLMREPTKRLTAQQVLNNPWVVPGGAKDEPIQSEVLKRLQGFGAMNKLKKEAVKIIVGFLPENEIRGLSEMFHAMDTDGSGTITVAELREGFKAKGTKIQDAELTRLMESADLDGDGNINYEEFIAAMLHESKLQHEEHLYKAFKVLDADGSGFIDKEELIKALGQEGELADLEDILKQVDSNDDGQIDYEEFCAMMRASAQLGNAAASMASQGSQGGHRTARARHDIEVGADDKVTLLGGRQHTKL